MKDRSHDETMAERFQIDPSYAAELLAEVVRDGNADEWPSCRGSDRQPLPREMLI